MTSDAVRSRRSACATLFPYTTLFRSFAATRFGRVAYVERGSGPVALFFHGYPLNGFQWRGALERIAVKEQGHRDRKSTRLNSSHLGISYAAFCLKKKKTEQKTTRTTH